jgi:hypothetical protein
MPEIVYHVPSEEGTQAFLTHDIEDTYENRMLLEDAAIQKCGSWRAENNKTYCCSAYCPRCAGMRALDGVEALTPNQWLTEA